MAAEAAAAPLRVTDAAWQAIEGGYDLQVHVAPDVIARRIDDLDLAKEFLAHKLKGFVLKSHYAPTYERAKVVTKASPGIQAFGAITLNHSVGGLNPVALEIAGRSGNKIVWMPTVDAANETAGRSDGPTDKLPFWAKNSPARTPTPSNSSATCPSTTSTPTSSAPMPSSPPGPRSRPSSATRGS